MPGMGEFIRPSSAGKTVRDSLDEPESPKENLFPDEPYTLISVENIYRSRNGVSKGRHGDPVLLLKKGVEVASSQLPRLMKNGASPNQFRIKTPDGMVSFIPPSMSLGELADLPVSNPILEDASYAAKTFRSQKRVLILDSEPKSLRRLIDCLFRCGFHLANLHPVRMFSSLNWALQKYTPHVLVVDYRLSEKENGIQALHTLQAVLPFFEQVILTTPPLHTVPAWEARRIEEFCEQWNVQMLSKPVSRSTLKNILDKATQNH